MTAVRARNETWATSVDTRVEQRGGSTVCQQTMSTPEEQMTMTVQQLYVRLQQFQETLATTLQAARNELVKQVQNATSTTTQEEPIKTCGSVVQTEIISRSRGPAERAGTDDDKRIVDAETQQGAQHADVLHTRDDEDTGQVSQRKCERGVRREKAVRERMGAKVCWTPEERVVLPTQRRRTDTDN